MLAREYGISRQRVDQIRVSYDIPGAGQPKRERAWNWSGGRRRSGGYVLVLRPDHPRARRGYVPEHVVVAEEAIGRPLALGEVVHHINGKKDDNRPENLAVMLEGDHARLHGQVYTKEILLDALRWLALRLGHTPASADLRPPGFPIWFHSFYQLFGSLRKAQAAAGLTRNSLGGNGRAGERSAKPLPPGFRERYAELERFATVEEMLEARHGGLRTQHERQKHNP